MKKSNKVLMMVTMILIIAFFSTAIIFNKPGKENRIEVWGRINTYFTPPGEFRDETGNYRSVLKFYDGTDVKTKQDWERRRREILDRWNSLMGEWPPLLKDNKLEILDTTMREGFMQCRIRLEWIPGSITDGYLLIPGGKGKKPAVITVYYEPESAAGLKEPLRDFAYQLTKRGFITLSLGTTEATKARTYALYFPGIQNAEVQPLSMLGCAAANAWYALAKVPGVDPKRIGIMGHSFGGKWSMFAACLFDKFACTAWSDPGIVFDETRESVNYWEPWYLGYHPQPWRTRGLITSENPVFGIYPKLVREGYDLHELHALMAPRPFLVSGGSEDTPKRWIPLNQSIAVNKLLGYENRVAMTNRPGHSPTVESNEQIYLFFEYFLKYKGINQRKNDHK